MNRLVMGDVTQSCPPLKEATCPPPQILPLVYEELRRLAARRLVREKPGQTLQATALVHEAHLRLVEGSNAQLE